MLTPSNPASKTAFADLRLRKHADYQRAYNASRKQHAKELTWFCARRDAMPTRTLHPAELLHGAPYSGPRIGLTVGKVMGKAHDRNRIKRRMRAAVALHAGLIAGLEIDVILHPRRSVLLLDWEKLQREVANVFRAVRKQCGTPKPAVAPAPTTPAEI
ncbi:ribonuclease P protein component [Terriglobus roseus DSM 18391]|uniref:Ribonuclease P protein component n=1 Tax=Terriglobus roseus (strain DSM 18391 / NRRL B-41598 / KBS 63) TaxID=926566 RepID=I3ZMX6_TERRK|nr:ribonuclease P protein component [Terriglobus roseus]AFL90594.1 ribonuclease P protein component [Terriglobus roseus DSM 18391]